MSCITYDCNGQIPAYELNDCPDLLAGYSAGIILECGHGITDPSSAAQINAALAAGKARLYPALRVGIPLRSPISIPSNVSGETDTVVNYDNTATWVDGNVNGTNDEHYTAVFGGRKLGGLILYSAANPDEPHIVAIMGTVKVTGGVVSADQPTESERYEGTFTWRKLQLPVHYPAPAGIFD